MKKKELLSRFKIETEKQLSAIQNEDPEGFLISVEACDGIIKQMNSLEDQVTVTTEEEFALKIFVSEIIAIREQISSLLPSLKSKLEQNLLFEKRKEIIQQGYGNEAYHMPSIFFDKKK